jgi:hypothetical protein
VSRRDPFELLVALNPVAGLSTREDADDAMFEAIIAAQFVRRRRPPVWVIGGAVVAVTVSLAAFVFLRRESPSNPLQLVCYPTAEEQPRAQFAMPMTDDPVGACAELWTKGPIATDERPPELTACILETGIIAVIPGDSQVCARLGLANWVGDFTPSETDLLEFQDALVARFLDRCVTDDDVESEVRALMAEYGVASWRLVQRGGYTSERQCSVVTTFADQQLVVIASRPGISDNSDN